MKYLKTIRLGVSFLVFLWFVFCFVDFAGWINATIAHVTRVQWLPAILAFDIPLLLFLLITAFLFGRYYCSFLCPLGVLQDISSRLAKQVHGKRKKHFRYRVSRAWLRWGILTISVFLFAIGIPLLFTWLDPYSAFGRISTHIFRPAYLLGNNVLAFIFNSFGNYTFYPVEFDARSMVSLLTATATLLVVGVWSWFRGRGYCNTLCPVGTMLGLLNKFSLFKIRINEAKCNRCGACQNRCKASCLNATTGSIDYSRCVNCFNCITACKQGALTFAVPICKNKQHLGASASAPCQGVPSSKNDMDPSRRQFLLTAGLTLSALPVLWAQHETGKNLRYRAPEAAPIMPPGALHLKHFTAHCTACHLCVSKCPQKILQPALMEYGIEGMLQPRVVFNRGYCESNCKTCSDICPTGALRKLSRAEKRHEKIGEARVTLKHCVITNEGYLCGACAEHCPNEAIQLEVQPNGLRVPSVITERCTGCGACEFICPADPEKAIKVWAIHNIKKNITSNKEINQ